MHLNELYYVYVEIYFSARELTSVDLSNFSIRVNGLASSDCSLEGMILDGQKQYGLAQRSSGDCLAGTDCIKGCDTLDLDRGDTIQLIATIDGVVETIDEKEQYFTDFEVGRSFQAVEDGVDHFEPDWLTPGAPNGTGMPL